MKKSFFIVLICVALLLTCCSSSNQNSSDISDTSPSAQETEPFEIKDYPEYIDTFSSVSYFYTVPDEVFTSTAEENGLSGTVYTILGRITEYIYDENGEIEAYRVFTPMGDVLVVDFYHKIIEEVANDDNFPSIEPVLLRGFLPIPPENEFIRIYAEYQGTSSDFGYEYDFPFFLYGGSDYLANVMIASAHISDETTPEETQETSPPSASSDPTEEAKPVTQYGAGMYKVGIDLPAGEYLFFANDRLSAYVCASTDSNQDDILENENFDYTFFMTVEDGQYLQAKRCVFVDASSTTVEINADGSLPEGMYRVGIDIPAGEYKLTADDGDSGYWCTYNSTIIPFDIEDNDNFDGSTYVTVTDGQYLIINRCTAKLAE